MQEIHALFVFSYDVEALYEISATKLDTAPPSYKRCDMGSKLNEISNELFLTLDISSHTAD